MSIPNFINILASDCFLDAAGNPLAKGTLAITAVDGTGKAIPFRVGGGGIALVHEVSGTITAGSLDGELRLANPAAADITVGYTFVITDSSTFETTTFPAVAITADDSGNFDLAALNAGSYATAEPVAYVPGPPGTAATIEFSGVDTLAAGAAATVTNTGTSTAAVIRLGIPRGADGAGGSPASDTTHGTVQLATGQSTTTLAKVATSGAYGDLTGTPALAVVATSGTYSDLSGRPALATVATSGTYADLNGKPALATSATTDTTNAGNISSGTLPATRLPDATASARGGVQLALGQTSAVLATVATSGSYSDLSGKPALVASATTDTTNAGNISSGTLPAARLPDATASARGGVQLATGQSSAILAKVATSGAYGDLSGTPALAPSATTDTTNAGNISSGTIPAARLPDATAAVHGVVKLATGQVTATLSTVATTGAYSDLTGAPSLAASATIDTTNAGNISSGTVGLARLPVMVGSGASHAAGIVPDPGSTAGTTRFLREDGSWAAPSSSGGPGYTLQMRTVANGYSLGSAVTLYLGAVGGQTSSNPAFFVTVPKAGAIKAIEYSVYTGGGTSSASPATFVLYDLTASSALDTVSQVVNSFSPVVNFHSGLNIAVNAGDQLQGRITAASGATATAWQVCITVYIE